MTNDGTLIRYIGGKHYICDWIISYMPRHHCYVEVFGGGGCVLLRKLPSRVEVYNDVYDDVVNFFRVLRDRGYELKEQLRLYPYSRTVHREFTEKMKKREFKDDFERALVWFYLKCTGFNGEITGKLATSRLKNQAVQLLKKKVDKFDIYIERLRSVTIENLDFRECIKKYDSEETLFFCDPPYIERDLYEHNFTMDDHVDLAQILRKVKGKVMLTYERHSKVYELYGDWNIIEKPHYRNADRVVGSKRDMFVDLLITNFEPVSNKRYLKGTGMKNLKEKLG